MRYHIPLVKWRFSIPACGYAAPVTVPHTWNVDDPVMHHRGAAEYETTVFVEPSLACSRAFLYFGAVYHTAEVTVNGQDAGGHSRSGFTPFRLDVTGLLVFGGQNTIRVRVSNAPTGEMLPHGTDFDWADDGGIIRQAALQFMAPDAAEFLRVEERLISIENGLCSGSLLLQTAFLDGSAQDGVVKLIDYSDGRVVLEQPFTGLAGELPFARPLPDPAGDRARCL